MTILVTGGCGFIGSNFILHMLSSRTDCSIVNLDALTYAGNADNLNSVEKDARYSFVNGDICNRPLCEGLFARYAIDAVVHFAAESHVDRSITGPAAFVLTNVLGTQNLLECARNAWKGTAANRRFVHVSTDEVYGTLGPQGLFSETTPLAPNSPYSASKAGWILLHAPISKHTGFPCSSPAAPTTTAPSSSPKS